MIGNNTYNDFLKSYGGTTIRTRLLSSVWRATYVFAEASPQDTASGIMWFRTDDTGRFSLRYDLLTDDQFDFSLPARGLFEFRKVVHMLHRLPRRQWKKGVCSGTVSTKGVTEDLRRRLNPYLVDGASVTQCDFVNAMYETTERPFNEAVETVAEGMFPELALNRDFAVVAAHGKKSDCPFLIHHDAWIGMIQPEKRTIFLRHEPYLQEVQDYLSRHNLEAEWELRS